MKCKTVKICGMVEINDSAITALLADILSCLKGPLVVEPSAAWEAIFQAAMEAALTNVDIGLDAETLTALESITVVVDTSGGPVEITGEVTLADGTIIDVNVTNIPLGVEVTNWDELLSSTLNVSLNGEVVNVQLSAEQIEALADNDDTDDDIRPASLDCFDWVIDAGLETEQTGTFLGWAKVDELGNFVGYTVVSGNPPAEGADVTCDTEPTRTVECWKDKFIEGGLDNTKTHFEDTNQVFTVTFDNGDVGSFDVPPSAGFTQQVTAMAAGLSGIMPWAQTVDPFCTTGCGNLPAPIVSLNKMILRYVGFRVCPGDKVPVSVTYQSDRVKKPIELVVQYVETETLYLTRCVDCSGIGEWRLNGEPYTPVCAVPCGEDFADTPLTNCDVTYLDGCDDVGSDDSAERVNIIRAVSDCGAGPEVEYLIEDEDGALITYTLIGQFVDCASGLPIEGPKASGTPIPLGATCVTVNGVPTWAYPVSIINKEQCAVVATLYLDEAGNELKGEIENTNDCNCKVDCCPELPTCESNSVFFTTATIAYEITGVCDGDGNDISSQFNVTFPIDGNTLPTLQEWDDALGAWLEANGTNVERIQGRDGFTYTWSGPSIIVKQSGEGVNALVSCQDEPVGACPELVVGDTINTETGEVLAFPIIADGVLFPISTPLSINCKEECLAANLDQEIVVRVTQDHEALNYPSHRGYILSTSAGVFTAVSPNNTFETANTLGTPNIGVGYAQSDPQSNTRAIRWVEITMTVNDLCENGVDLAGLGFGGVGGAFEAIHSQTVEIVSGLEGVCDGC